MSVVSNQPTYTLDALSLKRRTSQRPAQRWELTTNLEPLTFGAHKLFSLFVNKGVVNPITIIFPQNYGADKARTSVSSPTATGAAHVSSVVVSGNTGLIPMGNFVQFANHSKVYMLTADLVDSGPMFLYPNLRVAVSATSFVFRKDIQAQMLLEISNVVGMSYENGILMDLGPIKMVENL